MEMRVGRWEGRQREAIDAELRNSEQRLLQLSAHVDESGAMDGTLF